MCQLFHVTAPRVGADNLIPHSTALTPSINKNLLFFFWTSDFLMPLKFIKAALAISICLLGVFFFYWKVEGKWRNELLCWSSWGAGDCNIRFHPAHPLTQSLAIVVFPPAFAVLIFGSGFLVVQSPSQHQPNGHGWDLSSFLPFHQFPPSPVRPCMAPVCQSPYF